LILHVEHSVPNEDQIDLGVQISTPGEEPIQPGTSEVTVDLDFWSDIADVHVVPGTRFTLRYPNRVVGRGHVLSVVPF
jgi:translation elongation factor EF-Tu-like GTPase